MLQKTARSTALQGRAVCKAGLLPLQPTTMKKTKLPHYDTSARIDQKVLLAFAVAAATAVGAGAGAVSTAVLLLPPSRSCSH
jgi:hypothetical protein